MNKPVKDIVLEILTIIQYPRDKDKFINDFLSANYTEALVNVTDKLPEDLKKKTSIANEDFSGIEPEDIEKAKQYISEEDFNREVERISKEAIKKLVDGVSPECTDEEKQKLNAIVASFDETPASDVSAQQVTPPAVPQGAAVASEASTPEVTPAPVTPQENPTQQ